MAEFFRRALSVGICTPSDIVCWADAVVAAEAAPHIWMIDLCLSGTLPVSSIQSLLSAVPGESTPEMPGRMLLGRAFQLIKTGRASAEKLLRRLYLASRLETFSPDIDAELSSLEDALSFAEDGVFGILPEVAQRFLEFLADFECLSPMMPEIGDS